MEIGTSTTSAILPWGAKKERLQFPQGIHVDLDLKPGEFILRSLFAEFAILVERKIEAVMAEPLVRRYVIASLLLIHMNFHENHDCQK